MIAKQALKDVVVTKPMIGLLHMQACVKKGIADNEVLCQVNIDNPCGTSNGWANIIRDDPDLAPVQCSDNPDREHVIINC